MTETITIGQTNNINDTLSSVISQDNLKIFLNSDLSLDKALNDLVNYQYLDKEIPIPENQFGLGYTNLVMIIANLIDYIDKYEGDMSNSKINLICIEEPETYMHPQMQELFIKYINDAINKLLSKEDKKNLNSQLVISTHSSHILNSKIHSGDGFDNINYVTFKNNESRIIILKDEKITPKNLETNKKMEHLKFIKKHIKFKVSELFFSDAVILVEGDTEYNLLPLYIDENEYLKQKYITIFNIGGAYGHLYKELFELIELPVLIITDLDIKREKIEGKNGKKKNDISQIEKIEENMQSTNTTLKFFNKNNEMIVNIIKEEYIKNKNIIVCYQNKIYEYYPTSFEEAFILTNFDNKILNKVLKNILQRTYSRIVKNDYENNKKNSYEWQFRIGENNKKTELANELFYHIVTTNKNNKIPELPEYIKKGLDQLDKLLRENGEIKNVIKNK
ncbi:hypothetical protein JCM16776_0030 [Leptotrichia shahii]|uniref:Uncharacterized protein n=1 Tax=Leptotrichia shahii TaxID=157691 RepID=A0A510JKJ9_9FUSO|nr:hypothetical protein JCM16776_0030 [Leptotrichia shahii]